MPATLGIWPPWTPRQYALLGVLVGLAFPVVATLVQINSGALDPDLVSIVSAHRRLPLLWLLDLAPFWMGGVAYMVGRGEARIRDHQRQLADGSNERIRALYEVVSNPDWTPKTQMREMLRIGCGLLDLEIGLVSRVEEDTFTIESLNSYGRDLETGQLFSRDETFSSITLESGELTAIHHVGESEWRGHLAYRTQGLEAYMGIPLWVHGETYGTLSFSSSEPRPEPFRETDLDLLRLMGRWVTAVLERQLTSDELSRSLGHTRAILETSVEGIIAVDAEGVITSFNPAAEGMFGYRPEEVLGKNVKLLIPEPHRSRHEGYMGAYLRTGEAKIIGLGRELEGLRRDGSTFPLFLSVGEMHLPDSSRGFVGVTRDITEQKIVERRLLEAKEQAESAREDAEEANRAKGDFVARVSHEIRTPMNGILGMTNLALGTDLDPEQREYLQMVRSSADALMDTINDILDFSKIEANKLVLDEIEFRFHDVVGNALKPLALLAAEKGLELYYRERTLVPDPLFGDPGRIRQILVNLVGNAIKFTEAGEVFIDVEEVNEVGDRVQLQVTVTDTGIGIPPDRLDLIFDAFEQADGSTSRTFGGTGLGLAISKQLTELMGGEIWAESSLGEGTAFHFTLLLDARDAGTAADRQEKPFRMPGSRVLVVDDHPGNRDSMVLCFQRWAMDAEGTGGGEDALQRIRQAAEAGRPFEVVLGDVHMPDMNGFDLAEALGGDAAASGLKVILMTSAGRQGDGARCARLGVAGYLLKPVLPSELRETVQVALGMETAPKTEPGLVTRHSLRERRIPLRVLVAEDNSVNQKLITKLLQKRGSSVTIVPDGRQVVEKAGSGDFDLVLMDLGMPVIDGLEATRRIRDNERGTGRHLPIVALTAHAMENRREACLAAGMDGYLSKPLDPEALAALLDRISQMESSAPSPASGSERPEWGAPSEAEAVPQVFDRDHTLSLVSGDKELLREIVSMFIEDSERMLMTIRSGLEKGDATLVGDAAHQLKGSSANFSALQVKALAAKLENLAAEERLEAEEAGFADLQGAVEQLNAELAAWVADLDD